jgi:hypothetical protein
MFESGGNAVAREFITANDILTSSGKYPLRKEKATAEIRMNARILAAKVNAALNELGYTGEAKISSGFRPPEANAAAGGAKRSLHLQGLALDFVGQEIGRAIRAHANGPEILRKHSLFMEGLEYTASWTHLDLGTRADRSSREFRPK